MVAMENAEKLSEALVVKVRAFLLKVAEEAIVDADEPDLLSERDVEGFVRRTLNELSMDRRIGLHSGAWVSDVEEYARNLARNAINEKLKKATSRARAAGAGREF
jgi:hypothetical protein